MNKIFPAIFCIVLLNVLNFAQTKSIADAETEIKTFQNFSNFSITYDDPKDLTTVRLVLDIRADEIALQKPFKKFEMEFKSLYAGMAIDEKPVRNVLCINTQSNKFNFASNNTLTVLIGNESINFDFPDRSTEAKGRKIKENLCWDITKEIIYDFAKAQNINFQIGSIKSSLSATKIRSLIDYANLLRSSQK